MATLTLGVHEMPYAARFVDRGRRTFSAAQKAYGWNKSTGQSKNTGEVAEILEARYGIMRAFYDNTKQSVIIPAIEHSVKGALINVMNGQPGVVSLTEGAILRLTEVFQDSLSMKKYDAWIGKPMVPTARAEAGVSHRFKKPYAKRAPRPSFIDTGLYQSSFVMWMSQ